MAHCSGPLGGFGVQQVKEKVWRVWANDSRSMVGGRGRSYDEGIENEVKELMQKQNH